MKYLFIYSVVTRRGTSGDSSGNIYSCRLVYAHSFSSVDACQIISSPRGPFTSDFYTSHFYRIKYSPSVHLL